MHPIDPRSLVERMELTFPGLDPLLIELARRVEALETYDDPAERRFRQYCNDHRLTFEIAREFGNWVLRVQGLYISHPDMSYCFSWALHQLREASA